MGQEVVEVAGHVAEAAGYVDAAVDPDVAQLKQVPGGAWPGTGAVRRANSTAPARSGAEATTVSAHPSVREEK
jgi:hypothetical protein